MADQSTFGAFIPTTNVFDVLTAQPPDVNSEEYKLFLVRLRQVINNLALLLNLKDTGYYLPAEFVCGQLYFPNTDPASYGPDKSGLFFRQVFRIVVNMGALLNNATLSVPHNIPNINDQYTFTRIYATASDTTNHIYVPIPNLTALGELYMSVDATNVNIRSTFNATNFNVCYAVLEYIKN